MDRLYEMVVDDLIACRAAIWRSVSRPPTPDLHASAASEIARVRVVSDG